MSDEKHTQQDEEQQDDLEVTEENADEVKGGSWHGGIKKNPDGLLHGGTSEKGPEGAYHGG